MFIEFSTANIQIDKDFSAKLSGYGCINHIPEFEFSHRSVVSVLNQQSPLNFLVQWKGARIRGCYPNTYQSVQVYYSFIPTDSNCLGDQRLVHYTFKLKYGSELKFPNPNSVRGLGGSCVPRTTWTQVVYLMIYLSTYSRYTVGLPTL